jgi:hypothetical protein
MTDFIDIVFAKTTDPNPDFRFVEVEDPSGASICAGEWIDRGNGLWALRIGMTQQWQPIETAPAEGKFMVYMPDEKRQPIQVARWHPNVKVIGGSLDFDMPKPSHWMALPEPPKDKPCSQ